MTTIIRHKLQIEPSRPNSKSGVGQPKPSDEEDEEDVLD